MIIVGFAANGPHIQNIYLLLATLLTKKIIAQNSHEDGKL